MSDDTSPVDSFAAYSRPGVIAQYARADYITSAEEHLLRRHLRPGMRILDLGVGGGRTSERLSKGALEYVGIDLIPAMIQACRARFPDLQFEVQDAADLSAFPDGHFDLVLFSFCGLGNLHPEEKRRRCLEECRRVLATGGVLMFSLHHARLLFFLPPPGTTQIRPIMKSLWHSWNRFKFRIRKRFFWTGSGTLFVDTYGGLLIYFATRRVVHRLLKQLGFQILETVGNEYPRSRSPWVTRWYYYAARKY